VGVKLSCVGERNQTYTVTASETYSFSSHFAETRNIDDCVAQVANNFLGNPYTFCSCTDKQTTDNAATYKSFLTVKATSTLGGHPDEHAVSVESEDKYSDGFGDRFHSPRNTANGCKTFKYELEGGGAGSTTELWNIKGHHSTDKWSDSWHTVSEDSNGYTKGKEVNNYPPYITYYPAHEDNFVPWFSKRITSKAETFTVPEIIYSTDLSGKVSDLSTFLNTSTRPFTTFNRILTHEEMYTSVSNHYTEISDDAPRIYYNDTRTFKTARFPFENILTTIICDDKDFVIFNTAAASYAGNHSFTKAKTVVINEIPPSQNWLGRAYHVPNKSKTLSWSTFGKDYRLPYNFGETEYPLFKKKTLNVKNWDVGKWSGANFKRYQIIEPVNQKANLSYLYQESQEIVEAPYTFSSDWHARFSLYKTKQVTVNWLIPSPAKINIGNSYGAIQYPQVENHLSYTKLNIEGWTPLGGGFRNQSATYPVNAGYTAFEVGSKTTYTELGDKSRRSSFKHGVSASPSRDWAYYQPNEVTVLGDIYLQATNIGKVLPRKFGSNFIQGSNRGTNADYFKAVQGERWPVHNIFGDTRVDNNIGAQAYRDNQALAIGDIDVSVRNYKFVTTRTKYLTIAGRRKRTTETHHLQSFGLPVANFTNPETAKEFWSFSYTDIVKTSDPEDSNKTSYVSSHNRIIEHNLGLDYNRPPNASTYAITDYDDSNWKEAKKPKAIEVLDSSWYGPLTQNGAYHSGSGVNSHGHESFNIADYRHIGNINNYDWRYHSTNSSSWLEVDDVDRGAYHGLKVADYHYKGILDAPREYLKSLKLQRVDWWGGGIINYHAPPDHGNSFYYNKWHDDYNYRFNAKDALLVAPIGVGGIGYDGSPFSGYIGNYYKSDLDITSYVENSNGSFDSSKTKLSLGLHTYIGTAQTFFAANPFSSINEPLGSTKLGAGTPFSVIYNPFQKKRNTFTDSNILSNNPEYFIEGMRFQDGVITKRGKPAQTETKENEDGERVTFVVSMAEMPQTGNISAYYESLFNVVSKATWNGQ